MWRLRAYVRGLQIFWGDGLWLEEATHLLLVRREFWGGHASQYVIVITIRDEDSDVSDAVVPDRRTGGSIR